MSEEKINVAQIFAQKAAKLQITPKAPQQSEGKMMSLRKKLKVNNFDLDLKKQRMSSERPSRTTDTIYGHL